MSTSDAVHLSVDAASLVLASEDPEVTDYARRYFGAWWSCTRFPVESVCVGSAVIASVGEDRYRELADALDREDREKCEETTYAKARTLVHRAPDRSVTAVSSGERLAYRHDPLSQRILVAGVEAEPVALAAARIARDTVRGMLLRQGWTLLHASAVTRDGRAVLALGGKGSGKTTTALALANTGGWELLANDRVFVRVNAAGDGVEVLPWPSAAAVGLGLLDALGWFDVARKRLQDGERLHATQHEDVTQALLAGRPSSLWEPGGRRERKTQIYPNQFADWFGLRLSTGGRAAALLFPRVDPDAAPAVERRARVLGDEDWMHGATEDRYPDILGLLPEGGSGTDDARQAVTELLDKLPQDTVALGHDVAANGAFLHDLLCQVVVSP